MVTARKKQNQNSNPAVLTTEIMPSYANFQNNKNIDTNTLKVIRKLAKSLKFVQLSQAFGESILFFFMDFNKTGDF